MDSKDEITSILNAIDEINTKSKKKNIITTIKKDSIPKLDQKLIMLVFFTAMQPKPILTN